MRTIHKSATKASVAILCVGLLILVSSPALSQEELGALVEEAHGEVEVSIGGADWVELQEGDVIPIDSRISTGFNSRATLAVGESSVLRVEPLTRIEIENLVVEQGVERSELNLQVGRIEGEVERTADRPTEFEVRSSIATASVRGTSFRFDGETLEVEEGRVAVRNAFGRTRVVSGGEQSSSDGVTPPESPAENRVDRATTSPFTAAGDDDEESPPATDDVVIADPTATLIIDFALE